MRKFEDYRIESLAFDNQCWRVDWLGAVTFAERYRRTSQPMIEVQLSRIPEDEFRKNDIFTKTTDESRDTIQVRLPVGFMPFLRIGDIWKDGRLAEIPAYDLGDFPSAKIDRTTTAIIKAGLKAGDVDGYYLPWEQHPHHMQHTQSYCVLLNYGAIKIVVPASELIRFYFGSSGGLISKLFDAPFDKAKFWSHATFAEKGKNAKIDLAPGISCRSAATVARIAFSWATRHAAEIVGKSCIAATANGQRAYPKALFPFEGETNLAACGRWLPFNQVERGVFLVFRLLSCSHPFPFRGLDYTGERKTASNGKTSFGTNAMSEADTGNSRYSRRARDSKSVVDIEPDKNKQTRDISLDALNREQFPDLGKKHVSKVDIDFAPIIVMTASDSPNITGVSVGDAGTDRSTRPVDFVAAIPALKVAPAGGAMRKFEPAVEVFLGLVSSLVAENRVTNVDIVRLNRRQRHDYLCTLPQIVDSGGTTHPWCQAFDSTGAAKNRKISIARVQAIFATHYIFVPELRGETPVSPSKLELHFFTDRSRSILREADLLMSLTTHLIKANKSGIRASLDPGVDSVWHELESPLADIPANLQSTVTTAHRMFMAFIQHNARWESPDETELIGEEISEHLM